MCNAMHKSTARRVAVTVRATTYVQAPKTRSKEQRKDSKIIHFMRHGQTEMNVYLTYRSIYDRDFVDPLYYDTRLTPTGERQADATADAAAKLTPSPEVLIVSPLSRALDTAARAFRDVPCPRVVEPLASERIWLSSDVGTPASQLRKAFPKYDLEGLQEIWWHTDGSTDPRDICPESEEQFERRMVRLRQYLMARPERVIALVAHWGVCGALTGRDFANCELVSCRGKDLWL